jgi:CRP-like cAMP-binding protein
MTVQSGILAQQLERIDLFNSLSADVVEQIAHAGQICHYQRGETLFHEEEATSGLFILLEGQVQLCKLSPQGQLAILAVFGPGLMFNEIAALDTGPNPVTAIALDDSLAWRLAPNQLETLLLNYPALAVALLRVLASRNRQLIGHFQNLSFRTVMARTAKLLLELSENGAYAIDRRRHPNHQMAARIATVPEAFSRSLKELKQGGEIHCTHKHIQVLNADQLSQIVYNGG